jgi:hypothetical protein
MSIEDIKEAIEVLEDASAEMLMETGDKDYYREAIAILRQAIEQAEQKTAVSPGKGTGFIDARALGITVLQPALETKQKTAVSPDGGKGFIDGVWHCQCGKSYSVTCISSKPKGKL